VRICKGLLELNKLRIGEGGSVAALLPARVVVQAGGHLGRAAVVLGEVASVAGLVVLVLVLVLVAAVVKRRRNHHRRGLAGRHLGAANCAARVHLLYPLATCTANKQTNKLSSPLLSSLLLHSGGLSLDLILNS